MIIDYRVYCSLYAVLFLAWLALIPFGMRYGPEKATTAMFAVGGSASIIGLINFIDWLWS